MKASVIIMATWVSLGLGMAQTNPPGQDPRPQVTPPPQNQTTPKTGTAPQSGTQTGTSTTSNTTTSSQASSGKLMEMKTQTYKGVLVDMSCASRASMNNAPSQPSNAAETAGGTEASSTAQASNTTQTAGKSQGSGNSQPAQENNSANRAAPESGESCPVSANSTELGMKMSDGRTVRFDLVGNQRAQDSLKNDKHWSKDLSAGKPIHATVIGALNGDKLIVSSIH